jgi:hypothetical protein
LEVDQHQHHCHCHPRQRLSLEHGWLAFIHFFSNLILFQNKSGFRVSFFDYAGADAPKKVFDKLPQLGGASVLNYKVDESGHWLLLIAITAVSFPRFCFFFVVVISSKEFSIFLIS